MSRIVVGVDGSPQSKQALSWSLDEAWLRAAPPDVVHAWSPPTPSQSTRPRRSSRMSSRRHGQEGERVLAEAVADVVGHADAGVELELEAVGGARAECYRRAGVFVR